jgi:hypothetical protein
VPSAPIVGAASVHGILTGWRHALQREPAAVGPAPTTVAPAAS